MVTQRIANPYDQHTSHSKVPVKEFIVLKFILQVLSVCNWCATANPKIFSFNFIYTSLRLDRDCQSRMDFADGLILKLLRNISS